MNGSTTATTFNQPYTGAGFKFLLTNNSDPASWFDYKYNTYQVYTDFEYVGLKTELGKGWYMELKPYTLNYDNGELYSNATPITELRPSIQRRSPERFRPRPLQAASSPIITTASPSRRATSAS